MPDRAIGQRSQQFVLFLPHNENDVPPDLVAWIIPKNILLIGFSTLGVVQMPHKFNAARRHKFDKVQYRVINWAEY